MTVALSTTFLYFFTYSFIGWLYESFITSVGSRRIVNRGFLNGPYCPIYGFGALLFVWLTSFTINPLALFFLGGTLACILEYLTSFAMEKMFRARWWDYSDRFLNLNGRICLAGFVIFGLFAACMPIIHGLISIPIDRLPQTVVLILAPLLSLLLLVDLFFTTRSIKRFNEALDVYQKAINQHAADALDFIRRGRRSFELYITNQHRAAKKVLTFQQRRLLSAFPELESHNYSDALNDIRKLNRTTHKKKANRRKKTTTGTPKRPQSDT